MTATELPPGPSLAVESFGPEQRVLMRSGESWSRNSVFALRSGVALNVATCHFQKGLVLQTTQQAAEIDLVVAKGAVVETRMSNGASLARGGNTLQLATTHRTTPIHVHAREDTRLECVSLSLSKARLCELLGASELPEAFRHVAESSEAFPLVTEAMTPALSRVLDEILHSDVAGRSRLLWHEAKSLELLALMSDELGDVARASQRQLLSANDTERLERVRGRLLARLDVEPTLTELARLAGINETKLKASFRALYGSSIFAYLRQARLEEARRLLFEERHLNVTEVSLRVGYSNPSKFAAAFRRAFGVAPSAL